MATRRFAYSELLNVRNRTQKTTHLSHSDLNRQGHLFLFGTRRCGRACRRSDADKCLA
ncbi:hypothetical protein F01_440059 [Burkholderia cenocepacia]|nr:hypothetical protein F01_440059 [Burkholderia cenocepacia]